MSGGEDRREEDATSLLLAAIDSPHVMAGVLEPVDRDYRYVTANAQACAFYGRKAGDLDGMTGRELGAAAEHIRRRLSVMLDCLRTGAPMVVEGAVHPLGRRPAWFLSVFSPLAGRPRLVSFVAIDITERRRSSLDAQIDSHRLRLALEAAHLGIWDFDVTTGELTWDARLRALFDVAPEARIDIYSYINGIHPDDRSEVEAVIRAAMASPEAADYAVEHRVVTSAGDLRWIRGSGRVLFDETGSPFRVIGAAQDITEQIRAREHQDLLVGEMNHRVKNNLATVHAIVEHSWRAADGDAEAFRTKVDERLGALALAHDVIAGAAWTRTEAAQIIQAALAPFTAGAIKAEGPALGARIPPEAGLNLTMALHELATNASKYGALSVPAGQVHIRWRTQDGVFHLDWNESGGPVVTPPAREGFGSRLLKRAMANHGGSTELQFHPQGLACRLRLPLEGA